MGVAAMAVNARRSRPRAMGRAGGGAEAAGGPQLNAVALPPKAPLLVCSGTSACLMTDGPLITVRQVDAGT